MRVHEHVWLAFISVTHGFCCVRAGEAFMPAVGMVTQVTHEPELSCKEVLVVARNDFERAKVTLNPEP